MSGAGQRADGAPSEARARLACSGVAVRFGGLVALNYVDLAVPASSIVGLVGPNGAGKSTLFGVLSGLTRPSRGRVLLDGIDVTGASPQERAAHGLARTFQHPEIFAGLTVRQHLVLAHRVRHQRRRVWSDLFTMGSLRPADHGEESAVDELVDLLGLGSVAERSALGLPLGYNRLVELGRALASDPTVLLLDEPSSGLDSSESAQFETTLTTVARQRSISVLLVEHDVDMVMRMCDSVYVLDFGSLIAHGTPEQVSSDPAVRAAYLGEEIAQPEAPATAGAAGRPIAPGDDETDAVVKPRYIPRLHGGDGHADVLAVEGVDVRYGDALALSDVSFTLGQGLALAVLGVNGAGKSSLARALSGLVPVTGGRILIDGEPVETWSADRIRRAGVVHLPEGRGVFRSLSVLNNLRMAAKVVSGRKDRRSAVGLAMEIFPVLADRRRQVAGSLSGGEQQMLSLARALATAPKLLIADEMSLGLAPRMVEIVFEGLGRARQAGVSVIMIEQYVHRALAFADQCLLLQRGSVAWSGPAGAAAGELLGRYIGPAMTAET